VKLASHTHNDYEYYEKEYVIKGRRHGEKFRLGDNVRVKVVRINAFSERDRSRLCSNERRRSLVNTNVIVALAPPC
jgi:exoribonuclease R